MDSAIAPDLHSLSAERVDPSSVLWFGESELELEFKFTGTGKFKLLEWPNLNLAAAPLWFGLKGLGRNRGRFRPGLGESKLRQLPMEAATWLGGRRRC